MIFCAIFDHNRKFNGNIKYFQVELQIIRKVINFFFIMRPWWFSVGICKYKLGYKSHDLL